MHVTNTEHVSALTALQRLSEVEERTNVQEHTLEFLKKALVVQDAGTAEEMEKELGNIKEFKPHQLHKLTELAPFTEEQVNAILSKERIRIDNDDVSSILTVFKSARADMLES